MKRRIFVLLVCAMSLGFMSAAPRRVHTIGDSTMSDYRPAATPKRGWGMYLQAFFKLDSVQVNNRGKSGASTRTFYETDNLWPSVKKQMKSGDYLIIQFAHNDEKCKGQDVYQYNDSLRTLGKDTTTDMRGTEPNTTYKEYLRTYIIESRAMGVTPILMSPICRVYFKDGEINSEGKHFLKGRHELGDKNYVRCMREVAEEMDVPFLDMTKMSEDLYEQKGQDYCMSEYFNCGDKTHTSAAGGMANAELASRLIRECKALEPMHAWLQEPTEEFLAAYSQKIEDAGKSAAFSASGTPFDKQLKITGVQHLEMNGDVEKGQVKVCAEGGAWPAGEIDEVANRYVEYKLEAPKKKALVVETIMVDVKACGGDGMNIHINAGFGEQFRDVVTLYENTALPKNKKLEIRLTEPLLVPAGQTLHLRILPWYDSKIKPQNKKFLYVSPIIVKGKEVK